MEAHPSKPNGRRTLWHELRDILAFEIANGGQVSIINRLDRETSGLTLVAKSHAAARTFHQIMEQRGIEKEYLALVWGWPIHDEFTIEVPLLHQRDVEPFRIYLKQIGHPDGALASTRFKVERRFSKATSNGDQFAIVRCFPKTGRMHQIRVHLSEYGHPIVGDKIYGPDEGCYLEFIETGWTDALARRLILPRQALHSAALHVAAHALSFKSPLPEDLASWIKE
ncbi:MAG: rna pseudouridylate synthase [Chthoniobacteraceae bacterium]|nr:rna pseudouridylate synthase [Chthoniobacteraceae bacterium]